MLSSVTVVKEAKFEDSRQTGTHWQYFSETISERFSMQNLQFISQVQTRTQFTKESFTTINLFVLYLLVHDLSLCAKIEFTTKFTMNITLCKDRVHNQVYDEYSGFFKKEATVNIDSASSAVNRQNQYVFLSHGSILSS